MLALAPPPTVTEVTWLLPGGLAYWSQNLLSTFSLALNSHKPVF